MNTTTPIQPKREPFDDLVLRDAFGNTDEAEAAILRSAGVVVRFYETLSYLLEKIDGQLAIDNTREIADWEWRKRALAVQHKLRERAREIKPLAKEQRRRDNGGTR